MNAQDSRSRDAANELASPHEGAPVHLEIPLGTPELQGPGVMERLIGRSLAGGRGAVVLMLLGGLFIAGGLVHAFNVMAICWTYEPAMASWPGCKVSMGWNSNIGPYLSGIGALGPALVFLGTTLWAVASVLRLRVRLRAKDSPSERTGEGLAGLD